MMDVKKIYYYIICLITLFVLMWGVVDMVSATFSLYLFKSPSVSLESLGGAGAGGEIKGAEPSIEEYYQRRMVFDRIGDSLARIVVSGLIFVYASWRVRKLERSEA